MRFPTMLSILVAAAAGATGLALAGGYQSTNPDACAVLRPARVKPVLGAGAISHREPVPLPELPRSNQNINDYLDVFRTSCTWADLRKGTFVNTQVYERNDAYTGKKPWSPADERAILAVLGSKGYYILFDNDRIAKQRRAPWLAGEDVMLVGDRATHGRRHVILGTDPTENLWIVISVIGGKRSAIDVATAVTRQLLGG